ncbi:dATP pyrophosphohydrolase [Aureimonas psammosilenae]|uniref:dATP pyrophosphohydrolase n=1 Tax=Aureimonas psammosilenae TaxID=2495496 RepID=UPI00126090AA|nr:dATP pyrophosphohydrolase [Aureimonas psammosilenae]
MIDIRPVSTKRELDAFIALPNRIQKGDPNYVAPLKMERHEALSPKHNPFFNHAEVRFLAAFRGAEMVGRISAQADRRLGDLGHFGLLSAQNDPAIFAALFKAAEDWLRERGRTRVLGPFDLNVNEEIGTLVEGFDTPPMLLMPHNPPWQGARIEEQGFAKAKDVLAFLFDNVAPKPGWSERIEKRPLPKNVVLRQLDWKRYEEDLASVVSIFNDAWADNWNFMPLGRDDLDAMAKSMKPLIRKEFVQIAELKGEPVAFGICLPNLNEAIRDLGGDLLPLGWAKLLWRLKVKGTKTARIPLMGVKKSASRSPIGALLPMIIMNRLGREGMKVGVEAIEMSWILEDNHGMMHFGETMAGAPYKRYRIYEKTLAA